MDAAEHLGVKNPSVSRAVKVLVKQKYPLKAADGALSLTEQGLQTAAQVYEKHQCFTRQLIEAGLPPAILRRRTPAGWSTSSARRALRN